VQPPPTVLHAFGVESSPVRRLVGGQGTSWVAGDVVLKPDAGPVRAWLAGVLADVEPDGVRLASPVATRDGTWDCAGWSATRWVEGQEPDRSAASTWIAVLEAGRSFHRAVAHLSRPDCLDARTDWWAAADRAAWHERPLRLGPGLDALAARLEDALEPLGDAQVVHADLTGNVLFADGLDPVIIDISPYWRPTEYADGIVVADALCWYGASPSLLDQAGVSLAAVARALLFRMATTHEIAASGVAIDLPDEVGRYSRVVAALGL
jgi:uncharacterized protein (TIGR02569 family)